VADEKSLSLQNSQNLRMETIWANQLLKTGNFTNHLCHYCGFPDEVAFPKIKGSSSAKNSGSIVSAQEHETESSALARRDRCIQQWPSIIEKSGARIRTRAGTSPSRKDSQFLATISHRVEINISNKLGRHLTQGFSAGLSSFKKGA
jgi:hypothetical protein